MMQLIVLSLPRFFASEAHAVIRLFEEGMPLFHLRKPGSNATAIRALLREIPTGYHNRIVLHDAFALTEEFGLKGIHLNSRNNEIPSGFTGTVSRSCHTLQEVAESAGYDYVFLSPIFSSISKEGYGSGFPITCLQQAHEQGIISSHVIALGGINQTTLPLLKALGFGGAAVLGGLWADYETHPNLPLLTERFRLLQHTTAQ